MGEGSALSPLGLEGRLSTGCESSGGCCHVALLSRKLVVRSAPEVGGADMICYNQAVLIASSPVPVFKTTSHLVGDKDGELTGTEQMV